MSDSIPLRQVSTVALRGLVGLLPWAMLLAYIAANSTPISGSTNWGEVTRLSVFALVPLLLAVGLTAWMPSFRNLWLGWTGVLVSWAVMFCAFFAAGFALGPFI